LHLNDSSAGHAKAAADLAYGALSAMTVGTTLTGLDLGSLSPLTPGVYSFASAASLNGTLVLDFLTNPTGSFVFQIGSSLITGTNSVVSVLNAGPTSTIYWQVGSSATLGDRTSFAGNLLANASVTLNSGASILGGRAIALGGGVTLIDNLITNNCSASGHCLDGGSLGYSGGLAAAVPEPDEALMLLAGLGTLGLLSRRRTVDRAGSALTGCARA
jgi:type VI secretion system secreted protein VgrG